MITLSPCFAQEDNIIVVDDRPLVINIPEGVKALDNMVKAGVDYFTEDDLWRQSAYEFLYGDMNVGANKTNMINNTNMSA